MGGWCMVTSSGTARRQVAGEAPALRVMPLHHAERQRRGTQPARLRAVRGYQVNEARASLGRDGGPLRSGLDEQPPHAEGDRDAEQDRGVAEAVAVVTGDHAVEAVVRGDRRIHRTAVSQVPRDHHWPSR